MVPSKLKGKFCLFIARPTFLWGRELASLELPYLEDICCDNKDAKVNVWAYKKIYN